MQVTLAAAAGVLTSLASAILHSSRLLASCASSQSLAAFAALALCKYVRGHARGTITNTYTVDQSDSCSILTYLGAEFVLIALFRLRAVLSYVLRYQRDIMEVVW